MPQRQGPAPPPAAGLPAAGAPPPEPTLERSSFTSPFLQGLGQEVSPDRLKLYASRLGNCKNLFRLKTDSQACLPGLEGKITYGDIYAIISEDEGRIRCRTFDSGLDKETNESKCCPVKHIRFIPYASTIHIDPV